MQWCRSPVGYFALGIGVLHSTTSSLGASTCQREALRDLLAGHGHAKRRCCATLTSFAAQAGRKLGEKCQQLTASQTSTQNGLAGRIDAVT